MSVKMTECGIVKNFKLLVFIFLLYIQFRNSVSQLCNANAYAGGYVDGQCVSFEECPRLLQILKSPEITRAEIRLLQNLTCEKDFENPTICCALNDIRDESKFNVQSNSHAPANRNNYNYNQGAIVYPTNDYPENSSIVFNTRDKTSPNNIPEDNKTIDTLQPLDRFGKQIHKNFRLLPLLKDCGNFLSSTRIVGGLNANHGEYPWMARIGYKSIGGDSDTNETEFYCGATVINKRYVLLAAHCTEEIDASEIEPSVVRLGEHNTETELDCSDSLKACSRYEDYGIEKVIPHKDYNTDDKANDIELIRVDRDIAFDTPFIRPICLPFAHEYKIEHYLRSEDLSQFVGKMGSVTGWGRTKWNKAEGSKILQQVFLPIVSNEDCQRNYSSRIAITDLQMCAGGLKNHDSCSGDSGGCLVLPLKLRDENRRNAVKYFQLGVVSFGPVQCGVGGLPGVYSRVSKYKNWILDNLEP